MSNPTSTSKDFFISYTGRDRSWAEWIAWVLEEAGYMVVIQAWDFRVGGNFVLDMQQATIQANRTIAVLSSLYLDKPFPQSEWAAAFALDPTSQNCKLIPIRVEDCHPPGLLAQIVHVDVFDCAEAEAQQRLLAAIQEGRMKPNQRPQFPGRASERQIPAHVPFPGTSENTRFTRSLSHYGPATWVGRDSLIKALTQKLQEGCRILALRGITGIGKTVLAERLVVEVYENGAKFHRLNFDDRKQCEELQAMLAVDAAADTP
ncbi:toll/interleukin-1 receptor domain-containing protein [Nostoc sp.]|uniref:toll/interleukin-1 receptor domain-containing protein n=1 Tax=Nostoc sp. TaxID=1180 RepID=UPI002FFC7D73